MSFLRNLEFKLATLRIQHKFKLRAISLGTTQTWQKTTYLFSTQLCFIIPKNYSIFNISKENLIYTFKDTTFILPLVFSYKVSPEHPIYPCYHLTVKVEDWYNTQHFFALEDYGKEWILFEKDI